MINSVDNITFKWVRDGKLLKLKPNYDCHLPSVHLAALVFNDGIWTIENDTSKKPFASESEAQEHLIKMVKSDIVLLTDSILDYIFGQTTELGGFPLNAFDIANKLIVNALGELIGLPVAILKLNLPCFKPSCRSPKIFSVLNTWNNYTLPSTTHITFTAKINNETKNWRTIEFRSLEEASREIRLHLLDSYIPHYSQPNQTALSHQ